MQQWKFWLIYTLNRPTKINETVYTTTFLFAVESKKFSGKKIMRSFFVLGKYRLLYCLSGHNQDSQIPFQVLTCTDGHMSNYNFLLVNRNNIHLFSDAHIRIIVNVI